MTPRDSPGAARRQFGKEPQFLSVDASPGGAEGRDRPGGENRGSSSGHGPGPEKYARLNSGPSSVSPNCQQVKNPCCPQENQPENYDPVMVAVNPTAGQE